MDTEAFLTAACELLAVPSTYDRPDDLSRALDLVLGFAGPGFTVERFESSGKPSALVYHGRSDRTSGSSSTLTSTSCRPRRTSSSRAGRVTGCTRGALRT